MITTFFSKSGPFNYFLVIALLIMGFSLFHMEKPVTLTDSVTIAQNVGLLVLLMSSLILTDLITKKNELSKGSTYSILFFFSFLIMIPGVFEDKNLIISGSLIILAVKRLISLQTQTFPKEKIFDASAWIFIASLFHFWSILFILVVFVSVILHVSRDYRNWLLPYLALFSISVIFAIFSLMFDNSLLTVFYESIYIDLDFNYFTDMYQNIALSVFAAFAVLFLISQIMALPSKPVIQQSAFTKLIISCILGIVIFIISPNKGNQTLIFTCMPLSIMATSYVEGIRLNWFKEVIALLLVILSITVFIIQL
ncbi:MAG: DUF6427 family protein [Flavobacterium sp.]